MQCAAPADLRGPALARPAFRATLYVVGFVIAVVVGLMLTSSSAAADPGPAYPDGAASPAVVDDLVGVISSVPVDEVLEPVAAIAAPLAEPVAAIAAPLIESVAAIAAPVLEPVVQIAAPVLEPVVQIATPIVASPALDVAAADVVMPVVVPSSEASTGTSPERTMSSASTSEGIADPATATTIAGDIASPVAPPVVATMSLPAGAPGSFPTDAPAAVAIATPTPSASAKVGPGGAASDGVVLAVLVASPAARPTPDVGAVHDDERVLRSVTGSISLRPG